nr:acyl-CoA dehydrogenase [uncultured Brevundimonas sp.]
MDLTLSETQTQLADSVRTFLARLSASGMAEAPGAPEPTAVWREMGEALGVLALALPEDLGGLGGEPADVMVVMEAFGEALLTEPYLETVVTAAGLLRRCDQPRARALAQAIGEGAAIVAPALTEPAGRADWRFCATRAERDGDGWRLIGGKGLVTPGASAQSLIVAARTRGDDGHADGLSLFLVERDTPGLSLRDVATLDERWAAEVVLDGVSLSTDSLIGVEHEAGPLIALVLDEATAALCAEAIGVLRRMLDDTVAFAKERRQFGQAIGRFQALQHRMADMFIQFELARSAAVLATLSLDKPDRERTLAVSAAKVTVSDACRFIGQNAVQLHGGLGMSLETEVTRYFKRAAVIETQLGTRDHHLDRTIALDVRAA